MRGSVNMANGIYSTSEDYEVVPGTAWWTYPAMGETITVGNTRDVTMEVSFPAEGKAAQVADKCTAKWYFSPGSQARFTYGELDAAATYAGNDWYIKGRASYTVTDNALGDGKIPPTMAEQEELVALDTSHVQFAIWLTIDGVPLNEPIYKSAGMGPTVGEAQWKHTYNDCDPPTWHKQSSDNTCVGGVTGTGSVTPDTVYIYGYEIYLELYRRGIQPYECSDIYVTAVGFMDFVPYYKRFYNHEISRVANSHFTVHLISAAFVDGLAP